MKHGICHEISETKKQQHTNGMHLSKLEEGRCRPGKVRKSVFMCCPPEWHRTCVDVARCFETLFELCVCCVNLRVAFLLLCLVFQKCLVFQNSFIMLPRIFNPLYPEVRTCQTYQTYNLPITDARKGCFALRKIGTTKQYLAKDTFESLSFIVQISLCFVYDYLEKVILLNLSTPLFFSFVEYCKHSSALKTELVLAELVTCL